MKQEPVNYYIHKETNLIYRIVATSVIGVHKLVPLERAGVESSADPDDFLSEGFYLTSGVRDWFEIISDEKQVRALNILF